MCSLDDADLVIVESDKGNNRNSRRQLRTMKLMKDRRGRKRETEIEASLFSFNILFVYALNECHVSYQ